MRLRVMGEEPKLEDSGRKAKKSRKGEQKRGGDPTLRDTNLEKKKYWEIPNFFRFTQGSILIH